jgi:hypothetical protein
MFRTPDHYCRCWHHERRSFRDGIAALLILGLVVFGLLHAPDLTGRHHHVHHRPSRTAPVHPAKRHGRSPARFR